MTRQALNLNLNSDFRVRDRESGCTYCFEDINLSLQPGYAYVSFRAVDVSRRFTARFHVTELSEGLQRFFNERRFEIL